MTALSTVPGETTAYDRATRPGLPASPEVLRRLPRRRLGEVASALRREIIDNVSRTGGHLGASLGAVELSTALHYAFDTPRDRIVFDVGHQGYAHKLLTGRAKGFPEIGQPGGNGKFLRRCESPHDVFGAGHAGTSISAAVGIAESIRRQDGDEHVVAVIGDGAITAGMAYEAMNHAGDLELSKLVVVLNDNRMSISPNVGALSDTFAQADARAEDGPGPTPHFFEALGFDYLGPVDGHDLEALLRAFSSARRSDRSRPVLVHCRTQKGHGYAPAERDPVRYHGVGRFDVASGRFAPSQAVPPSWTSVFADALTELAQEDERILGITAAMAEGTGLARFRDALPDRYYDVGIAEQHAVTMAAGMATEGLKPVCAIYSTFLQRAFDQIVHDVCVQNLDVTFVLDRGGLVGADGATHQGLYDFAYLRTLPNMLVMAPRDENELRRMLRAAILHPGPAALRFPRGSAPGAPIESPIRPLALGEGEKLRDGDDVALIAVGATVATALQAAEELARDGIAASVLDARFVKPLDADGILAAARHTRALITLEEHVEGGGFGEAVTSLVAREAARDAGWTPPATRILALPDRVIEHGIPRQQLAAFGLDAPGVARTARGLLQSRAAAPKPGDWKPGD